MSSADLSVSIRTRSSVMWTLWTGDLFFATENTSRPATKRVRYAPAALPIARVPTAGVPAFATV